MEDRAFKVGDRVLVPKGASTWATRFHGRRGTITGYRHDFSFEVVVVDFDGGGSDYGRPKYLLPESPPTPTTPGQYTATVAEDGTLTLTPVRETQAVEEKPKVRQGQIWRVHGTLCMVTRGRNIHLASGEGGSYNHESIASRGEFIARSLAEALESGKITAADLR